MFYTSRCCRTGLISGCMLTVSGSASRMAARLQLQMPACRLLEQSSGSKGKDQIKSNHLQACYLTTLSIVNATTSVILLFSMARQPLVGQGLLNVEVSRSHSRQPHSVGLLWTSDRPLVETSTWQHTTITTDRHPCPGGIRTRNPSKRATTGIGLRQWQKNKYRALVDWC